MPKCVFTRLSLIILSLTETVRTNSAFSHHIFDYSLSRAHEIWKSLLFQIQHWECNCKEINSCNGTKLMKLQLLFQTTFLISYIEIQPLLNTFLLLLKKKKRTMFLKNFITKIHWTYKNLANFFLDYNFHPSATYFYVIIPNSFESLGRKLIAHWLTIWISFLELWPFFFCSYASTYELTRALLPPPQEAIRARSRGINIVLISRLGALFNLRWLGFLPTIIHCFVTPFYGTIKTVIYHSTMRDVSRNWNSVANKSLVINKLIYEWS